MARTVAEKLSIKEGMKLLTIHAPANFISSLGPLPAGVEVAEKLKDFQQIHWFVQTKAEVEKETEKVIKLLKDGVICWIYYPKITSRLQTDLSRDKGWDKLLAQPGIKWITLVSFNDTWSSFSMRLQTAADKTKEAKPVTRPIFDYIDPVAKTIRLPEDFDKALQQNQSALNYYNSLAFSHRKEYVEWIVTAKRAETRQQRVQGAVEKLDMKWKNPADR